jgi:hypothetical protein
MIDLGKRTWFIKIVTYLNEHWAWWKKYIYGNPKNMEDFVRNPAEVLKHTTFPFTIRNVKFKSLLNLRIGFIPFNAAGVDAYVADAKEIIADLHPLSLLRWLAVECLPEFLNQLDSESCFAI